MVTSRSTTLRLAAATAAVALTLAACGGDDEGPTVAEPPTSEATDAPPSDPDASADGPDEDDQTSGQEPEPTEDPTDDATDEPVTPDPSQEPTTEPGTGAYADVSAALAGFVADHGGDDELGLDECPLMNLSEWQTSLDNHGHPQVQLTEVEVEVEADDGFGITGLVCTAEGTPDDTEAGIAIMDVGESTSVEDFITLMGDEELSNMESSPGPADLGGQVMATCDDGECVAFWYDENIMVAVMLNADGADEGVVAELARSLAGPVLEATASLS